MANLIIEFGDKTKKKVFVRGLERELDCYLKDKTLTIKVIDIDGTFAFNVAQFTDVVGWRFDSTEIESTN